MKKIFSMLLILMLVLSLTFSLCACQPDDDDKGNEGGEGENQGGVENEETTFDVNENPGVGEGGVELPIVPLPEQGEDESAEG